jgi:hypothetical protein
MAKRFYIYEGNSESRDEGDNYASKSEAKERVNIHAEQAEFENIEYIGHVVDRKTGQFIYTRFVEVK